MKVLICGDRQWSDWDAIEKYIKTLPPRSIIIQGMCRGADLMARHVALEYNHLVADFPAKWALYGKAAGPIRNKQMLIEGKPDRVVAFHNNLSESRGTANMIKQAKEKGIPVEIRASVVR